MMKGDIAAYIPCCNNAGTLPEVVESVRAQSVPVADLTVIDDASHDSSVEVARSLGVRCIRMERNSGRGAVRARAFEELRSDFILSVDATNSLEAEFLENALPLFADSTVAFVRGELYDPTPENLADRWRARHLFHQWRGREIRVPHKTPLATYGCVGRRSAVLEVGNFAAHLRHSEDAELGRRLELAGYRVLAQPQSRLRPLISNSVGKVLERYWRWHAGEDEQLDLGGYLRAIKYSLTILARRDLEANDWSCVPVSLLAPHYQFWRTVFRRSLSWAN